MTDEIPIPDDIMQTALDLAGGMLRNYDQEDYSVEVGMAARALMAERMKWVERVVDRATIIRNSHATISEMDAEVSTLRAENERLRSAAEKVIEMNLQHAQDELGDRNKAEKWACVVVLRAALKGGE